MMECSVMPNVAISDFSQENNNDISISNIILHFL